MDIEKMLKEITATYNNFDYQSHLKQPDELYHYTSLNTLQIILKNKQLRFTNRAYLNDKSEGTYVLSLCKEKIDELWPWEDGVYKRNTKKSFCEYLDDVFEKFDASLFQSYQVSFSYKADSLSMWNYYAQGDGCNLQFSTDFLENFRGRLVDPKAKSLVFLYGNVVYNQDDQLTVLKEIFNAFKPYGAFPATKHLYYCMAQCILKMGSFFKHPSFEDERECRIVFNLSVKDNSNEFHQLIHPEDGTPYKRKVYAKQGMLVPYVDIDFDLKYLQSITVSPTSNFEKVKQGLKIVLCEQGITDLPINHSEIPLRF